MSETTTVGLRVSNELLQRIDQAAAQQGQNRTAYILSWLPVYHDRATETTPSTAHQGQRVGQRRRKPSPVRV